MRQLVYASMANSDVDEQMIQDILAVARKFNTQHGITGILMYRSNVFMQLLEGEPQILDQLYERILKDKRHHMIVKLCDRSGSEEERIAPHWRMAYRDLKDDSVDLKIANQMLRWHAMGDSASLSVQDTNDIMLLLEDFSKSLKQVSSSVA